MERPGTPIFLARQSYRHRRVADAARLLPVAGLVLLMLPVLWTTTAGALIYIFMIWAILIFAIGLLSTRLSNEPTPGEIEQIGEQEAER